MTITPTSSLREVAFAVCSALEAIGVTAVLTGGSAATVWAPEAYQSRDCDFIISFARRDAPAEEVLARLGYRESGGTYVHGANPFTVEFPPGPLSVGDEILRTWETLRQDGHVLHVLSPTDSCRDRLAAFYHWRDYSSLRSAVAIAQKHPVDQDLIRTWSRKESAADKYEQFLRALTSSPE